MNKFPCRKHLKLSIFPFSAWFQADSIKPFEEHKEELAKKNKSTLFLRAIREAEDPSIIEKEEAEKRAEAERKEAERKKRKSMTPSKAKLSKASTPASGKKKSKATIYSDDEEEEAEGEPEAEGKKRRKKADMGDDAQTVNRMSSDYPALPMD